MLATKRHKKHKKIYYFVYLVLFCGYFSSFPSCLCDFVAKIRNADWYGSLLKNGVE